MSGESWNPWKLTALGMALMIVTAVITGVVVANWTGTDADKKTVETKVAADAKPADPKPAAAPVKPATAHKEPARPLQVAQATPSAPVGVAPSAPVGVAPTAPAAVPPVPPSPSVNVAQSTTPSASVIEECNRYAADHTASRDKTMDTVKNAGVGALVGAAVGAAGGAIAGGGKGAGKGAAIGGLVGAGGGTVYGLNENKKHDEAYRSAYASCMHSRGFSG
jgi:hypothetical protein